MDNFEVEKCTMAESLLIGFDVDGTPSVPYVYRSTVQNVTNNEEDNDSILRQSAP